MESIYTRGELALRVICQLLVNNIIFLANNVDVITAGHYIFNIVHNIINAGSYTITIYVDGQGITADWLTTFLVNINYYWSHDLIRQLADFRR